jgi:hypothetical protein
MVSPVSEKQDSSVARVKLDSGQYLLHAKSGRAMSGIEDTG